MNVKYRGGIGWSAACPFMDGFAHICNVDGGVAAFKDDSDVMLWRADTPSEADALRYLMAASSPTSEVQAVGIGQTANGDVAYVIRNWKAERLGPVSGPYGAAIQWRDGEFKYYVKRTTEAYEVNGNRVPMPDALRGEAYGFQFIRPDGRPVFWIEALAARWEGGKPLQNWSEADGIVAGVVSGPEEVWAVTAGEAHLVIPGKVHSPRVASNKGRWAVTASGSHGAAFIVVPPYPAIDVPPPPVDPPPPIVVPPKEPPVMNMPLAAWQIVVAMHLKYGATLPATEDGGREFTRMAIEQILFTDPTGGWCWKRADPTRPPSKDCVARQTAGRFEGWDVLGSAGVTGPRVLATYPPAFHDLIAEGNQVPIPVTAQNHLGLSDGGDDDDPGDTDTPPPPPPDTTWQREIERRLTALENAKLSIEIVRR